MPFSMPISRTVGALLLGVGPLLAGAALAQQVTSTASRPVSIESSLLERAGLGDLQSNLTQLSYVRQQALRESAQSLGTRLGLIERSREILRSVEQRAEELDAQFNFAGLSLGPGVLPPVISVAKDGVTLEARVMRVSSALYHIDEPARFGSVTWRDWLALGLSTSDSVDLDAMRELLPRDVNERAYWNAISAQARAAGVAQADQTIRNNMAALERSYLGMRTYYDLYKRGMVTAPVLATAQSVVDREDPNTIAVGNTVFRITQNAAFRPTDRWVPLE